MPYQYNGNGDWVYVEDNPSGARPPAHDNTVNKNPPPNLTDTSNRDTTESTNNANNDYIEIEQNILNGDLNVIPNPNYKAKTTVLLQYLGKNLTGLYFVDTVVHTFDKDGGYSQTMNVSRNGFGDTIKTGSANKPVSAVDKSQGGLMNGSGDSSRPPSSTPTPKPPSGPVKTVVNKWAVVTPSIGLNIRTGPSTSYKKISAMPVGTRCYCRYKQSGWYELEWGNIKGWSDGRYLRF